MRLLYSLCHRDLAEYINLLISIPSLLSGNEVLFSLETASDYVKDEKACFYGFKCVAIGYEFNPGPDEVKTQSFTETILQGIQ